MQMNVRGLLMARPRGGTYQHLVVRRQNEVLKVAPALCGCQPVAWHQARDLEQEPKLESIFIVYGCRPCKDAAERATKGVDPSVNVWTTDTTATEPNGHAPWVDGIPSDTLRPGATGDGAKGVCGAGQLD